MENVQKAAELLQIPRALTFTNGRLVSNTTYKIKKTEINDFTQGPGGPVVTVSFSVETDVDIAGEPVPNSVPKSSNYAFNALSPMLSLGGFGYTYTGETAGVHRLYLPHYEGIDDDPLSLNYGLYTWYNWQETLIEQTGPSEVTWTSRIEPGINTYGYYDATPEHPTGSPTPAGDYNEIKVFMQTTSKALTSNGLSAGVTYNSWIPIQEILDNSNWTIEDIVENTRSVSVWDTNVDHTQYITSVAVEVTQIYSTGASSTYNGELYVNGILHSELPELGLTTAYYSTFNGVVKRWVQHSQKYITEINPGAYYVFSTNNTFETADDCHIIMQYEDYNTIDWANQPPGLIYWVDALDYNTRIMKYSEDSYLVFEIEELPANSHNFAVGVKINLQTGARYAW
jgi:hypothetical protein